LSVVISAGAKPALQEHAHELASGRRIAPALDQDVQHLTLVVDRPPEIIHLPAIRTTISSRCQRGLGFRRSRRRLRAMAGPNFSTQRRTVS